MTLLPNIEVLERGTLARVDGRVREFGPQDTVPDDAIIEGHTYFLEVGAVRRELAVRKAKNFLRAKHPADALNVNIENVTDAGEGDLLSEAGPQMLFHIDADVRK